MTRGDAAQDKPKRAIWFDWGEFRMDTTKGLPRHARDKTGQKKELKTKERSPLLLSAPIRRVSLAVACSGWMQLGSLIPTPSSPALRPGGIAKPSSRFHSSLPLFFQHALRLSRACLGESACILNKKKTIARGVSALCRGRELPRLWRKLP
eukprot:COSAG06_NODE_3354_length_5468_cov_10.052710_5_plen_151_part_00